MRTTRLRVIQFRTDDATYAVPFEQWDDEEREVDERGVPLSSLSQSFIYAYDFGDGWEHDIEVLGRGGDLPGCVGGGGACPREDCGGPHGYNELLEALADDRHPDHEMMSAWVGDRLRPFDQETTSRRIRDAVGVVPESVRLVLDLLRRRQAHPRWPTPAVGGPRRTGTPPGLVPIGAARLDRGGPLSAGRPPRPPAPRRPAPPCQHGVLRTTKAAGDETQTVRRLRSWFAPQEFSTVIAERAVTLLEAHGPMQVPQLATEAFDLLGHGWQRGGQPITAHDVERELHRLSDQLQALDLIDTNRSSWSAGLSARRLLPGATLLADLV